MADHFLEVLAEPFLALPMGTEHRYDGAIASPLDRLEGSVAHSEVLPTKRAANESCSPLGGTGRFEAPQTEQRLHGERAGARRGSSRGAIRARDSRCPPPTHGKESPPPDERPLPRTVPPGTRREVVPRGAAIRTPAVRRPPGPAGRARDCRSTERRSRAARRPRRGRDGNGTRRPLPRWADSDIGDDRPAKSSRSFPRSADRGSVRRPRSRGCREETRGGAGFDAGAPEPQHGRRIAPPATRGDASRSVSGTAAKGPPRTIRGASSRRGIADPGSEAGGGALRRQRP